MCWLTAQFLRGPEMGYRPPQKVFNIAFDAGDLKGFTLRARTSPSGKVLDLAEADLSISDPARVRQVYADFISCVEEWNLDTEAGEPAPVAVETLLGEDPGWVAQVIAGWLHTIAQPINSSPEPEVDKDFESSLPME